ncbi:MAG TPA: 4'-phosphopantetheinyl transferase superfamily protein [bacterium]|jgi:4'-phosphopantetheinyl transferase|nr:4'-phosphopantetheinyl transferase superfamily protein [bacterium]
MIPDPTRFPLDEIHIHLLRLHEGPTLLSSFLPLLSPDERTHYRHFQLESRRREFLGSRLMIRRLAATYLSEGWGDIEFGCQAKGKPFVKGSPLRFSLSHSGSLIACSFGWREVGIDVERIDCLGPQDWALLAERYFSPAEYQYLFSQPRDRRPLAFVRIFTRKEAYVKALGQGLGLPFKSFTVPLPPEGRAGLQSLEYLTFPGAMQGCCLSHVAENKEKVPLRYQIHSWDEALLADALKKETSRAVSGNPPVHGFRSRHHRVLSYQY